MDFELFAKMYISGVKYKDLKKEFSISFATINVYRIRLGLPKREKSFERFEFDESRFLELYNSTNPFFTYADIASELGCCEALITNIKRRLGLPDREIPSKLNVDIDKFRQMYLSTDYTLDDICEHFQICISTLQKLKIKLCLPPRKNKSTYNEDAFIKSYNDGLSNHKLASLFGMERRTVTKRIQELGLPTRKSISLHEADFRKAHAEGLTVSQLADKFEKSRSQIYVYLRKYGLSYAKEMKPMEAVMNTPEPARCNKKSSVKECIKTKVLVPVEAVEEQKVPVKNHTAAFTIPPKSLREIQKMKLNQDIRRAEATFKITHKENGYGNLLGKDIDNEIISPFSR